MTMPYLKVWTGHTLGNLSEQWLLDFDKLRRIYDVKNLFNFSQEHDFLLRARFGPEFKQATDDRLRQSGILFEKLYNTVSQLCMVQWQAFDLVQRQQNLDQKLFVFGFKWQSKTIDYAENRIHTHIRTELQQQISASHVSRLQNITCPVSPKAHRLRWNARSRI